MLVYNFVLFAIKGSLHEISVGEIEYPVFRTKFEHVKLIVLINSCQMSSHMIEIVIFQVLCNIFYRKQLMWLRAGNFSSKTKFYFYSDCGDGVWVNCDAVPQPRTPSLLFVTASQAQKRVNPNFFYYFWKIKCAISNICIFLVNLQKPWIVLFLSSYLYCFYRVNPKNLVFIYHFPYILRLV